MSRGLERATRKTLEIPPPPKVTIAPTPLPKTIVLSDTTNLELAPELHSFSSTLFTPLPLS